MRYSIYKVQLFAASLRLIYLSTLSSVCQELFSKFFEEFSRSAFGPNSSVFSAVLSKLHRFVQLFVCRSLERLDILSHHIPFVNTFFQVFSKNFQTQKRRPFGQRQTDEEPYFLRYTCRGGTSARPPQITDLRFSRRKTIVFA